jgi:hypothetical protein
VTYEWSRANLNNALGGCHTGADPDSCLDKYSKYVRDHAAEIGAGERFSFAGEYVEIDDDTIDTGIDGVAPVVLDAGRKLVLSTGWSRKFDMGEAEPVLFDLVGQYEDVSDDPMRQDRGIIILTLTRKLAGVSVPFGIVYANHGEFLSEVDERLSAHVGLKFDAFTRTEK